jgi:hypothetical protein
MSALQMLDMCVQYIARRHHMLTDEHVNLLDEIWELYEPGELPPLPPSPPPERQHLRFDEVERPDKEERCKRPPHVRENTWDREEEHEEHENVDEDQQDEDERDEEARRWQEHYEMLQQEQARKWQEDEKERQWNLDVMWRQLPQGAPVSASMQKVYSDEDCCSDCDEHGEIPTCDADRCNYECGQACGSAPPVEIPERVSNLTCNNDCGQYGCLPRQHQAEDAPNWEDSYERYQQEQARKWQIPPVVASVVEAAIESDDEMPALISFADSARARGLMNPEEADETEIVDAAPQPQQPQQPQPKPPKAQTLFPYNHHLWPSPRAKAVVRSMLGDRAKVVLGVNTLTHDACMSWLARAHQLTNEQLLSTSIYELHNRERLAWNEKKIKPYWQLPPLCRCPYCRNDRYH